MAMCLTVGEQAQELHWYKNMRAQICFRALDTETPNKEAKRQGACWLGVQGNGASYSWYRTRRGNKKEKLHIQTVSRRKPQFRAGQPEEHVVKVAIDGSRISTIRPCQDRWISGS